MITNSSPPDRVNPSAALRMSVVAVLILLLTIGGVASLRANLTTTYSMTSATLNSAPGR